MSAEGLRNMKAVASDISDGFVTVNPIFLKTLNPEEIKTLNYFLTRKQNEIRIEPFAANDLSAIRNKSMRLQRISLALTVIKNYAKAKKLPLQNKENKTTKKRVFTGT